MELTVGHMRLSDHDRPTVQPGRFKVAIRQDITTDEGPEQVDTEHRLAIDGHRFSILPEDIYSVNPPLGSPPGFHDVLPHVVLARSTLPWERRITAKNTSDNSDPWLCVIVLSAQDFDTGHLPDATSGMVRDLIAPPRTARGPDVQLSSGIETADDPCRYLDLPRGLAQEVLPRRTDLRWMAHVRTVRTDGKETWSHLTDGRFAVLSANRVPVGPASCHDDPIPARCFVLSLEGHGTALDANWQVDQSALRFAVLGEWSYDVGPGDPFRAAMLDLDPKPGSDQDALLRPRMPAEFSGTADDRHTIENATARGFSALRHQTRVGTQMVSWYQGPLTPGHARGDLAQGGTTSADQYLTYDPASGMFDTSYAAAWQLGRLLALQNKGFATALTALRHTIARAQTKRALALDVRETLQAAAGTPLADDLPPLPTVQTAPDYPVDDAISGYLARLALLYGVPLEYLLPHPSLIGDNAIRFFRLDMGWVAALLDGCLSIGRVRGGHSVADDVLHSWIKQNLPAAIHRLRHPEDDTNNKAGWKISGYLLRSEAVGAWLGIESRVDTDEQTNAKPLRIDRLAPDLLFCLFEGDITKLTVSEPPEGVYFGFDSTEPRLRLILRGPPQTPREGRPEPLEFSASVRTAKGRIDMDRLAGEIGKSGAGPMSSALLAHYLIQSPLTVEFSDPPLGASE